MDERDGTAVDTGRCPACGEAGHGDSRCRPIVMVQAPEPAAGPCTCLPGAQEGWLTCASCGLPQRPGKAFCGFCGRKWVTEQPG
jgi:hypothetical protein